MKIAIVSTDMVNVNDHFGKANRFLIYEISMDKPVFHAERAVSPLSVGDQNHPFDRDRFEAVLEALKGCERVYSVKIGERPATELKKAGIEPMIYSGPIEGIVI